MKVVRTHLGRWKVILAFLVFTVGVLALVGWQFDLLFLKVPVRGLTAMNPLTALLFVASSLAVLLVGTNSPRRFTVAQSLLVFVLAASLIQLVSLMWNFIPAIDVLLYHEEILSISAMSARMAPNTAVNFILISLGALMLTRNSRRDMLAQLLVLASILLTLFAILGYVFRVPEFYGLLPYFPMALHSALAFLFLGVAILFDNNETGFMKEWLEKLDGSYLARWLIPAVLIVPITIAVIRLEAQKLLQFSTEFGVTILVLSNMIIFVILLWVMARRLNERNLQRMAIERERDILNHDVQAANEELATQNEELTAANEELFALNEQLASANDKIQEQTQTILNQKDEQLNRALESMGAIVWSFDLTDKGENYLSRSISKLTNKTPEEIINDPKHWLMTVHPDDHALRQRALDKLYEDGFAEATFRVFAQNNEIRWLNAKYILVRDENGKPIRSEGVATDVTLSHEQELAIRTYQENLDIIFTNTVEEILLLDSEGRIVLFNQAHENFIGEATGVKPHIGEYVWNTTVRERREVAKKIFSRALQGETITVDALIKIADKEIIHELRYQPVMKDGVVRFVTIISTDVTERRKHQRLLDDFQSAIYRSSIVSRADKKGDITFVNAKFEEISGYSKEELLGKNHRIINSGYHPKTFWVEMWKTIASGHIWREEVKNKAKDGSFYWVDTFVMPFLDDNGRVREYLSIRNDITKRKMAEEELAQNKYLLDKANEVSKIGYWTYDLRTDRSVWNDQARKIFGLNDSFPGNFEGYLDLVHPDDRQFVKEAATRTIQGHQNYNLDHRIVHGDGSVHWIHEEAQLIKNDGDEVLHLIGVVQDITERKLTEAILREYNERYEILSMATNDAIWDWDIDNDVEVWNHGLQTIFGYSNDVPQRTKRFWLEKINAEDFDQVLSTLQDCFAKQRTNFTCTYRFLCANNEYRHVLNRAYIVYQKGKPIRVTGAIQDITDRIKFEQALQSLNKRFEIVLDTTGDAIWDWDIEKDKVEWGEGLTKLFGYELDGQIDSDFWLEKIHPADRERTQGHFLQIIQSPEKFKWEDEYRFRRKDGTYAIVTDRGSVIRDPNGKALRMVGAMQDITEQRRASQEIERLSLVASSTENNVIITNPQGEIEWVNNAFMKLTGYSLAEVIGKKPGTFLQGPETNVETIRRISANLRQRVAVTEEIINYTKTGKKYWLRINISPVFDSSGELRNFISIQSDISKQKEYENQITTIARELTTLIEKANVSIFGIDKSGYINEWNTVAHELSGYSKDEMIGKRWIDFLDVKIHNKVGKVIREVMSGKATSNYELPLITKSEKLIILLISISPRHDVNKNIVGAICVGQDLTEVIRYRQGLERMVDERTRELNLALTKEKELVEMKSKFVSIASHEFRTPLTTISIASGFIKKYKQRLKPEDIDQKLVNIEKQVEHMTHLLDDVLMIGKSEAGKIQINIITLNLREFIQQLVDEVVQSTKGTHRVDLAFDTRRDIFNTDEKLIRNIFINILTNAIKFSPEAESVSLEIQDHWDGLMIRMSDQGLGIPEEDQKNLFGSFYRASNVTTIQGTGLGLSIVKKAVDLLSGTVEIKSAVGEGTTVTIILPSLTLKST